MDPAESISVIPDGITHNATKFKDFTSSLRTV